MLICVYLDFDNTLFPSDYMMTFFDARLGRFDKVPSPVVDTLYIVDSIISKFLSTYMHSCRFRILTHATPVWLMYSLQTFMPNLYRYIEWNYIHVVYCENLGKADKVKEFLCREKMFDMYITCGDKQTDLSSVYMPVKEKLKSGVQIRQILFVNKPSLNAYEYQWTCMSEIFSTFIHAPDLEVRRHFVDMKNVDEPNRKEHSLSVVEELEELDDLDEVDIKSTVLSTLSQGTPPSGPGPSSPAISQSPLLL